MQWTENGDNSALERVNMAQDNYLHHLDEMREREEQNEGETQDELAGDKGVACSTVGDKHVGVFPPPPPPPNPTQPWTLPPYPGN